MFFHVRFGSLFRVMSGVVGVPACGVGMMSRFLMLAAFVMLRCLGVVTGCLRKMFGGLLMVLGCFLGHASFSSVWLPVGMNGSNGNVERPLRQIVPM
jgi:hypothetical protein